MHFHPVFGYQSEIRGILNMVERGCARLMKQGGGALPKEAKSGKERDPRLDLNIEQREQIIKMAKSGLYTQAQIARHLHRGQSCINGFLLRRGLKTPDGRASANRLRHI